jgi:hypothetical protein
MTDGPAIDLDRAIETRSSRQEATLSSTFGQCPVSLKDHAGHAESLDRSSSRAVTLRIRLNSRELDELV